MMTKHVKKGWISIILTFAVLVAYAPIACLPVFAFNESFSLDFGEEPVRIDSFGYSDIEGEFTSINWGSSTSLRIKTTAGSFINYENGESFPFFVDDGSHSNPGQEALSESVNSVDDTVSITIYIDQSDWENATPGTYKAVLSCKGSFYGNSVNSITVGQSLDLVLTIPDATSTHSVTINNSDNGVIIANKVDALEGDTITLTAKPDAGFKLDSADVLADGDPVELTYLDSNTFEFIMPSTDVIVSSSFVEDESVIAHGKCGTDAYWVVKDGVLTISGSGLVSYSSSDSSGCYYPWTQYKDEITKVVVEDGITSFQSCAFMDHSILQEVIIADSVTDLGERTFYGCGCLSDIQLGEGIELIPTSCFAGCVSLRSITLPKELTYINTSAFSGCSNLTEISIGDKVEVIEKNAFSGCRKLRDVYINSGIRRIGENAFYGCPELNVFFDGSIKDWLSIDIDTTALQLTDWYLYLRNGEGYDIIDHLEIPSDVKKISSASFKNCESLKTLTVNSNVVLIESDAFSLCDHLQSVHIDGVTRIQSAFSYCRGLEEFTLSGNVSDASGLSFSNCESLKTVTLDSDVDIGAGAFYGCTSLISIVLPQSQTEVGESMFYGCSSLESVTLSAGITDIGENSFKNCSNLKYVFYGGTEKQWNNIAVNRYGNDDLKSASIHYETTGHLVDDWIVIKEPTCVSSGLKEGKCTYCDYIESAEIEALGHVYDQEYITDVPPSCEEKGKASHHCIRCGMSDSATEIEVPALGHDYSTEYYVDEPATCTEPGSQSHHCRVCDAVETDSIMTIPFTGHEWDSGIVAVDSTATSNGQFVYTCNKCGETKEESFAKNTSFVDVVNSYSNASKASTTVRYLESQSEIDQYHFGVIKKITIDKPGTLTLKVDARLAQLESIGTYYCPSCGRELYIDYDSYTEEGDTVFVYKCFHTECRRYGVHYTYNEVVTPVYFAVSSTPFLDGTIESCSGTTRTLPSTGEVSVHLDPGDYYIILYTDRGSKTRKIVANVNAVFARDSISLDEVMIDSIPTYTYTGAQIKPSPAIIYCDTQLINGKDYQLSYSNNTYEGTGVVTIKGTGVFSGTKKVPFKIVKKIGWVKEGGYWYFYNTNGIMAKNTWKKDSKGWCYLSSDGKMVTNGWAKDSRGYCWIGADGYMVEKTKWIKSGGSWYHITKGYRDQSKWMKDSKGWCYVGSDGKMVTNGWAKDSKGWCWMGSNGYWVANKWIKDKGEWYYIKSNHYMAANEWVEDSIGWMYMNANGKITKSKWVKSGGYWYYLKDNGYMAIFTQTIRGKTYHFDSSGRWIR